VRSVILASVALVAVTATTAFAAPSNPSVSVSPKNGQVKVGVPPTFRATGKPGSSPMFLIVSRSNRIDPKKGVIDNAGKVWMTKMTPRGGGFEKQPRKYTYPSYWLNTSGTYYFQVFYVRCEPGDKARACHRASSVKTLTVTR
jgi:hypothetical protein